MELLDYAISYVHKAEKVLTFQTFTAYPDIFKIPHLPKRIFFLTNISQHALICVFPRDLDSLLDESVGFLKTYTVL